MKASLPILLSAVLLAIVGAPASRPTAAQTPSPPTSELEAPKGDIAAKYPSGTALLAASRERLSRYSSIAAKVRQRIDMFGQQIVASGSYVQGPPGSFCLRQELRVQIGAHQASVQNVADGETYWSYQQLLKNPTVHSVDLRRVRAALDKATGPTAYLKMQDALILGGLPKLLVVFEGYFEFKVIEEQQLGNLPVIMLRGEWREAAVRPIMDGLKAARPKIRGEDPNYLPQPLPDYVLIMLGRDDLFPYRIEYRRNESPTDRVPLAHGMAMLVMEWFEVRVNQPLERQWFDFSLGDLVAPDRTDRMLHRLGLQQIDAELQSAKATRSRDGRLR